MNVCTSDIRTFTSCSCPASATVEMLHSPRNIYSRPPRLTAGQQGFKAGQQGFKAYSRPPRLTAGQQGFKAYSRPPRLTAGQQGFKAYSRPPRLTAGKQGFKAYSRPPRLTAGQQGFKAYSRPPRLQGLQQNQQGSLIATILGDYSIKKPDHAALFAVASRYLPTGLVHTTPVLQY